MPPKPASHYDVLGVPRTATETEIKSAWRAAILKHHPERVGGDTAVFRRCTDAYRVLGDPTARAAYDQALRRGRRPTRVAEGLDIDIEAEVAAAFETLNDIREAAQRGDKIGVTFNVLRFLGNAANAVMGARKQRGPKPPPGG